MLQDILNKVLIGNETYGLDFDFAEVTSLQSNSMVTCKLLQQVRFYDDCLLLGEFYSPTIGDKGIIFFVGKQKYPCFYAFVSGASTNLKSGETVIEVIPSSGELKLTYNNVTQEAKNDLLQHQELWKSQVTIDQIIEAYERNAKLYNTDPNFFIAQAYQESTFFPEAISNAGAKGWAQFMPRTAKFIGLIDSFNVLQSIDAQFKYMFLLYNEAGGDIIEALGRYNGGAGWKNKSESLRYVPSVINIYKKYING